MLLLLYNNIIYCCYYYYYYYNYNINKNNINNNNNDTTLGGPAVVIAADIALGKAQGAPLGLVLNEKCVRLLQQMATLIKFLPRSLFITLYYHQHFL